MPASIDNPTGSPRDDGGDEDSKAWEQSFRAARPALPDAALRRIESAIHRELDRNISPGPSRWVKWIVLIALAVAGAIGAPPLIRWLNRPPVEAVRSLGGAAIVRDHVPLDVLIGPPAAEGSTPTSGIDPSAPRIAPEASIEAKTKKVEEGVTTYAGSVLLSAGPWRVACNKLTVFRGGGHGALLAGSGDVKLTGVPALGVATANEVTFNAETGEMKLAGRVHIVRADQSRDVPTCIITRTGEVRD